MSTFKAVFYENGIKTEAKSKKVNEAKLEWFLLELKKYKDNESTTNYIKLYIGRTCIKTKFLNSKEILELFKKWLDFNKS